MSEREKWLARLSGVRYMSRAGHGERGFADYHLEAIADHLLATPEVEAVGEQLTWPGAQVTEFIGRAYRLGYERRAFEGSHGEIGAAEATVKFLKNPPEGFLESLTAPAPPTVPGREEIVEKLKALRGKLSEALKEANHGATANAAWIDLQVSEAAVITDELLAAALSSPAPGEGAEVVSSCHASKDGWQCTLPAGHTGQHKAIALGAHHPVHVWPATPTPEEPKP